MKNAMKKEKEIEKQTIQVSGYIGGLMSLKQSAHQRYLEN